MTDLSVASTRVVLEWQRADQEHTFFASREGYGVTIPTKLYRDMGRPNVVQVHVSLVGSS